MKRRTLLKAMSSLGVIPALSYSSLSRAIVDGGHEGPLLLQIHAEGGWDVTSYCDPKVNQPGERPITTWSDTLDPGAMVASSLHPLPTMLGSPKNTISRCS